MRHTPIDSAMDIRMVIPSLTPTTPESSGAFTALAVAFFARVTGTTRVFTAAYTAMAPDMPGAADTARAVDTLLVPNMDMAVGVATGNDAPLARVAVRG